MTLSSLHERIADAVAQALHADHRDTDRNQRAAALIVGPD